MAVAPFAQTLERDRIIDYVLPFEEDGMGILVQPIENQIQKIFQIFRPLSPSSWLAIAIAALTTSLVLYLVTKFNPYIQKEDSSLCMSLWVVIGTLFGQGTLFKNFDIVLGCLNISYKIRILHCKWQ
jgi:hypothetical protein